MPKRKHEKTGKLNVGSARTLGILATRGTQFPRVAREIVED